MGRQQEDCSKVIFRFAEEVTLRAGALAVRACARAVRVGWTCLRPAGGNMRPAGGAMLPIRRGGVGGWGLFAEGAGRGPWRVGIRADAGAAGAAGVRERRTGICCRQPAVYDGGRWRC